MTLIHHVYRYYPVVEPLSNGSCPLSVFDLSGSPVKCDPNSGFVYDDFEMEETVVTEFDLVCDDQFKVEVVLVHRVSRKCPCDSCEGYVKIFAGFFFPNSCCNTRDAAVQFEKPVHKFDRDKCL